MILESWSIALIVCSTVTIIFGCLGALIALRVIRLWDLGSDSERQIRLEEQIWLTATLVQFGLVIQLISALLFIYAAAYFATLLKGAMCAAGALTANIYGLPALGFKLSTIFLGFLWIVLHRLDITFDNFPLTRIKSFWLLLLFPFLVGDALFVFLYLLKLEPEIITSCCGIIFADTLAGGYSLFDLSSVGTVLSLAGLLIALLGASSYGQLRVASPNGPGGLALGLILAGGWVTFYLLSLVMITVLVSPYVYALPHHRCPFDLLQYPYAYIGLPLYLFLHGAVLAGMSGAAVRIVSYFKDLSGRGRHFIKLTTLMSLVFLALFLATAGWPPVAYIAFGGE